MDPTDPTHTSPFVRSAANVFAAMMQLELLAGEPVTRSTAEHDVSAVVELKGALTGSVALGFPADAARRIVALMTGEDLDPNSPDFADALGELAGMVAGGAKAGLPHPESVSMSLPTVATGRAPGPHQTPCVIIPCSTDCGDFAVELALEASQAAPLTTQGRD